MSKERIVQTGSFPAIFAGVGMGLLVGLIIGISVSPVMQVILGALASLLGAFLGLQDGKLSGQEGEGDQKAIVKNRTTSLCGLGALGLLWQLASYVGSISGHIIRLGRLSVIRIGKPPALPGRLAKFDFYRSRGFFKRESPSNPALRSPRHESPTC